MFKKFISSIVLGSMMVSCASTTTINVSDKDARIFVDGEYKGRGTVTHTDQKIVGSTTHVDIKKEGCKPQSYAFSRNDELDVGACIGGVFLLFPFLWIMKYKPARTFEFECQPK